MILEIIHGWDDWLYYPLLNLLILFCNSVAGQNLAVAVVLFTVILRTLLLPFSIIGDRASASYGKLKDMIEEVERDFRNDEVAKNERIREIMNEHKVNPWSNAVLLAVQGLVLVLLYQVFVGGMKPEKLSHLYDWVQRPDIVYTQFLWFDMAQRDFLLSFLVGVFLFWSLHRRKDNMLGETRTRGEMMFVVLFPLFTFLVLWALPSVKGVFLLTSMLFSSIVHTVSAKILPAKETT